MNPARLARRAWPALIVILTLWPALMVLLEWRNVDVLDFDAAVPDSDLVVYAGRAGTLAVLALSGFVLLFGPLKRSTDLSHRNRARPVLIALIIFLLGHNLVPAMFGAVPRLEISTLYAFMVLFAAYAARQMPVDRFLNALKISLLVLMVAGLVIVAIAPAIALQYVSADLRLPIIGFRFWGLGSNPNNVAPLALVLLMLTVHTPFNSRVVTLLSYASGMVTLILAQSQTTWVAALLVLPLYALYCRTPKPIRKARINPLMAIGVMLGLAIGLMLIIWEAANFDFNDLTATGNRGASSSLINADPGFDSGTFTGRGQIWEVAIQTWKDHPIFGYGPTAWDLDFREMIGLSFAYNAHNQVMQSVSVGGWVALVSLLIYLLALMRASLRTRREHAGLALGLLTILIIRGFTEGPLDTNTLFSGEVLLHTALLHLLFNGLAVGKTASVSRRRTRRHARQASMVNA